MNLEQNGLTEQFASALPLFKTLETLTNSLCGVACDKKSGTLARLATY